MVSVGDGQFDTGPYLEGSCFFIDDPGSFAESLQFFLAADAPYTGRVLLAHGPAAVRFIFSL